MHLLLPTILVEKARFICISESMKWLKFVKIMKEDNLNRKRLNIVTFEMLDIMPIYRKMLDLSINGKF